jgi:hypothetical protein
MLQCASKAIHRSVSTLARLSLQVGLRHERFHRGLARGREDRRLPVGDVAPHRLAGHIGSVLHDESVEKERRRRADTGPSGRLASRRCQTLLADLA